MAVGTDYTLRRLREIEEQLRRIEARGDRVARPRYSEDNVADPPTGAQMITAFGEAATVGPGFTGLINDAGGNVKTWLCASNGVSWWYVEMTEGFLV